MQTDDRKILDELKQDVVQEVIYLEGEARRETEPVRSRYTAHAIITIDNEDPS